jgi:hypothetical protein
MKCVCLASLRTDDCKVLDISFGSNWVIQTLFVPGKKVSYRKY